MKKILDKVKSRVDSAEVFYVKSHSTEIGYEGWKLKRSSVVQKEGYSLRVVKNGKIGFAATTDPNGIDQMIDNAVATAEFGEQVDIQFPGAQEFKRPDIFDEAVTALSIEDLIGYGKTFIGFCERYRGIADLMFEAHKTLITAKIANTSGLDDGYSKTVLSWGGYLNRVKEGDVFMIGDGSGSTHLPNLEEELRKMTEPFHRKMELAEEIVTVPSGRMPVVFDPKGSMVLLLPIRAGINGRSVYTRSTPLVDKEGEKIFDEKLTIYDDGTLDRRVGTSPFDDEGLAKRRIDIVDKGVFKSFVFDMVTAAKSGRQSNGCGERGIFNPPSPSLSNLAVATGNTPKDEMIASIDEGLLVEGVLGLGQGNILSGAFSNPVGTAFKIEKGQLVGRVKNASIAGNIYSDLREISAIGDEQSLVYGSLLVPFIRVDSLNVAS
ncbi:MAG TPA: TldD/PmbA family protein [candidate division Zixibacteria bacterium]|nr:TldD/PmbA family protein [candidate division Zixibacteria bacterium]